MIQFRHSLLPLFAIRLENGTLPSEASKIRYLGVSYHFNDQGNIATCSHIVESLYEGETLAGVEIHGECLVYIVEDIRCHPKYDFAVGYVGRKEYQVLPIHGMKDLYIGQDVMAYGFTNDGLNSGKLVTVARLFKGHIVRTHPIPVLDNARSTCEVSFPSLNGFSGAPVLFNEKSTSIAGMLYSNLESTISLHSFSELNDSGNKYSEEIHKVVELGIMHTAYDIRTYINDLGIKRVALDSKETDELEI